MSCDTHAAVWPVSRQALYVLRRTEARSCNHCYSRESISITYPKCVFVALFIQHATRMYRIKLSSVACLVVQYFSTLSHKRHDFRGGGGNLKYKMCVLIFSTIFV